MGLWGLEKVWIMRLEQVVILFCMIFFQFHIIKSYVEHLLVVHFSLINKIDYNAYSRKSFFLIWYKSLSNIHSPDSYSFSSLTPWADKIIEDYQ
jgi:hypothetical protein